MKNTARITAKSGKRFNFTTISSLCRESGEAKTILFGLSGTGYFDLTAYDRYNKDDLKDNAPTDEELQKSFELLPDVN